MWESIKAALSSSTLICILSCSANGPPDGLCPSVMPKPVLLASVEIVKSGFGINK